jgi:hypothetical protein
VTFGFFITSLFHHLITSLLPCFARARLDRSALDGLVRKLDIRQRFAYEFPDTNGDNWLLTRLATFVDLAFTRL